MHVWEHDILKLSKVFWVATYVAGFFIITIKNNKWRLPRGSRLYTYKTCPQIRNEAMKSFYNYGILEKSYPNMWNYLDSPFKIEAAFYTDR